MEARESELFVLMSIFMSPTINICLVLIEFRREVNDCMKILVSLFEGDLYIEISVIWLFNVVTRQFASGKCGSYVLQHNI